MSGSNMISNICPYNVRSVGTEKYRNIDELKNLASISLDRLGRFCMQILGDY